jgi:hypothetical protein
MLTGLTLLFLYLYLLSHFLLALSVKAGGFTLECLLDHFGSSYPVLQLLLFYLFWGVFFFFLFFPFYLRYRGLDPLFYFFRSFDYNLYIGLLVLLFLLPFYSFFLLLTALKTLL